MDITEDPLKPFNFVAERGSVKFYCLAPGMGVHEVANAFLRHLAIAAEPWEGEFSVIQKGSMIATHFMGQKNCCAQYCRDEVLSSGAVW